MTRSPATILIVDDERQNCKLLEALLRPEGYLTLSAASGEEALASIARQAPDLILLDVMMPGMDGHQVASLLKGNPATANIPIIMVTALGDSSARLAGLNAGAEEFLTKPVDRAELWLRVRNLLRLKEYGDFLQNHGLILDQQVQARTAELQRFRSAMDATADAIYLVDRASMRFVHVNDAACRMQNQTCEELLALEPWGVLSTSRAELERSYDAIIASGEEAKPLEMLRRHKDGSQAWVELRRHAQHSGGRWTIVTLVRDITERKRADQKFRDLLEATPDAMVIVNRDAEIVLVNGQAVNQFGWRREELLGQKIEMLVPERFRGTHPGKRNNFFVHSHARPMGAGLELFGLRKDGTEFPVEISLSPLETTEGTLVMSTVRDITERKRADRMKNEFVSTVSHELRTPLTSIRGSLGLLVGGIAGELPEMAKNLIGIAKNNCERLIRLINDILDSEKIESGKIRFDLKVGELAPVLVQALADNEGFAAQHKVRLVLHAPREPLRVNIDSDRLNQVITNLLSNAVKFSPAGASVDISLRSINRRVRVGISDHGPGIPEDFRKRIFQKFSQADSSDTRQKGGTGLGLSISKAIIERMGGSIGFSTEAGIGTTFFVELPEWRETAAPTVPGELFEVPRPRILHVEDDRDIQLVAAAIAQDLATFEFAGTLDEARQQLHTHKIDLVLLGDTSGWDLFPDLETLHPALAVVVFSASEVSAEKNARVSAVLLKAQTSNEELLATLERVLKRSASV